MARDSRPPDARRCKPVLVRDVPLEERRKAASAACRGETDILTAIRIRQLAENPGNLVAWIAT